MAQATAEAVLITAVPIFLVKGGPGDFGTEQSLFFFGGTTFTLVIILANSKVSVVRCCVVRCGAVWSGAVWCGAVWCDAVWYLSSFLVLHVGGNTYVIVIFCSEEGGGS